MALSNSPRLTRRVTMSGLAATITALAAIAPGSAFATNPPVQEAEALVFDGGDILLAADGLWRSSDGGETWTEFPSASGLSVTAFAIHPDRPGRVLAALDTGGAALSEDGGTSWTRLASGLPEEPATAIAVDAKEPETFYLAVEGDGLWQSEDAGATWSLAMDRPWVEEAERDLLALASVDSPSGMGGIWIYAGTEVGLTRVPDCFCRWQDVQPGDAMDALVAGEQPAPTSPLPAGDAVLDLALAPAAPELIHAATSSGLWRSEDAGVNWARTSDAAAQALAVDPTDPNHIIAVTERGILASRDGGLSWAEPGL